KNVLTEIQDGRFAEEWIAESRSGRANFHRLEEEGKKHQIESVGKELRSLMPWISQGKKSVKEAAGGQS
ncbi:MAG TPA: ketol-acid reductoisomerase, partial [Microthrixaceae bacterium]|nr:ketol-acid reductoisomerase [Microthrixaceae bacterium]